MLMHLNQVICPPYMCTPVDTLGLCEDGLFWRELMSLAELGRARLGRPRGGGGYREAGV